MRPEDIQSRNPAREFVYITSRSSGPGGQNVNKVNTRVELRFDINSSGIFSEKEKHLLMEKLKNKVSNEGILIISSQSERSQLMNREKAEEKFYKLVAAALTVKASRRPTRATAASREERLESKKRRSNVKKMRKGPDEL